MALQSPLPKTCYLNSHHFVYPYTPSGCISYFITSDVIVAWKKRVGQRLSSGEAIVAKGISTGTYSGVVLQMPRRFSETMH